MIELTEEILSEEEAAILWKKSQDAYEQHKKDHPEQYKGLEEAMATRLLLLLMKIILIIKRR